MIVLPRLNDKCVFNVSEATLNITPDTVNPARRRNAIEVLNCWQSCISPTDVDVEVGGDEG